MYEYSTKLDAEIHGCSGFARIIHEAEGAGRIRMNPPNPPNSRVILGLQKNGSDADSREDDFAESVQYLVQKHRCERRRNLYRASRRTPCSYLCRK